MLHTKFRENRPAGSGEEDFFLNAANKLSFNVLKFNPCKKAKGAEACQKYQIEQKHLLQFPAQPSPFSNICALIQEIQVFEG